MKKTLILTISLIVITSLACGSDEKETNTSDGDDLVAFTQSDSQNIYQMALDGKDIRNKAHPTTSFKKWDNARKILNNTCGGYSSDSKRLNPISLVSPDGARLGHIDDSWVPNWGPDEEYIALACGRDDENNVIVVSDAEHPGSSEGWSRESRGHLSDRMNIYVLKPDGSEIREITYNNSGNWLPRWFPKEARTPENEFAKLITYPDLDDTIRGYETLLLIESNRDGNSEIYIISTVTTASIRLTNNNFQDQSPAWSRDGNAAVFSSNQSGDFKISFILDPSPAEEEPISIKNTSQTGRPTQWGK